MTRTEPVPWPGGDRRFATRTIALGDGMRIRVVECGEPDAAAVFFVHGWGCSSYLYSRNLPAVAGAGFRAITVDLPGHGWSDLPGAGGYALASQRDRVIEIIDALGLDRLTLVGQSMGGRIAIDVAAATAGRVNGLALISSVGLVKLHAERLTRIFRARRLRWMMSHLVTERLVGIGLALTCGDRRRLTAEDVEQFWLPARERHSLDAIQRALCEFDWGVLDAPPRAIEAIPVLALLGTRDRLLDTRRRGPLRALPASAELHYLDGVGHAANLECPEEVNRHLVTWLTRLTS